MTRIELGRDGVQVEAEYLAKALDLDIDALRRGMGDGTITSRFEAGEGKDAGRIRLTFFSANRRVQLVADESGRILTKVTTPLSRHNAGRENAAQDGRGTPR